jgi:hypothetical protein
MTREAVLSVLADNIHDLEVSVDDTRDIVSAATLDGVITGEEQSIIMTRIVSARDDFMRVCDSLITELDK